jgi:hypothetical protein
MAMAVAVWNSLLQARRRLVQLLLLVGIVLPALAAQPARAADVQGVSVPLTNPGFETGTEGWSIDAARFAGMISADKTHRHSGAGCLKISDPKGTANPFCTISATGLEPGATYRWRAQAAGDAGQQARAAVKIEFCNEKGESTSSRYGQVLTRGDASWQPVEVSARADVDTAKVVLVLRLFGRGTVYFDDVELAKIKDAPKLLLGPPRLAAQPGHKADLRVRVRVAGAEGTPTVSFAAQRMGGPETKISCDLEPLSAGSWTAILHLPELQPGQYVLRCKVAKPDVNESIFLFVPPDKRKPEFLSDDGTVLVAGKPFFPVGMYHAGTTDYQALFLKGFNCVQGLATLDVKAFPGGLAAAKQAGVLLDVPLYAGGLVGRNARANTQKVRTYLSHGSVLDWKIVDEPDLRPDVMDEVPAAYEALKAVDSQHPLLLTVATPASYEYWANFCDILQIDPYPISGQPLTLVADCAARAKAALQPWQNLTVVLPCGWQKDPPNQPTYEQARCMVYLALINGAKGIFWYSMRDLDWDLSTSALWTRFEALNKETKSLGETVLAGTRIDVKSVTAPAQAFCLRQDKKLHLLVANPSAQALEAGVELTVAPKSGTTRGGSPIKIEDKIVRVKLPPYGAEEVVMDG